MGNHRPPVACESDLLSRVDVRLLAEHERERFGLLLQKRHYLHCAILVGQQLCCVAELDGEWVALIAFSAASLPGIGNSPRSFSLIPSLDRFASSLSMAGAK